MLSFITGGNYCSRVVSTSFPRIVSRFEGGNPRENFFSRVKKTMVPSIYVRSSLNLERVSLSYYNIVGILHEQYHTKDTSGQCVCVSHLMCPISNIGSGKCVCVPSRCVPSIKLRGGTKS